MDFGFFLGGANYLDAEFLGLFSGVAPIKNLLVGPL